ncbi:MAG: SUMF1/EgtB/PvdO family nonheme iron enzyme, partial [Chitinophagaceae bacterium]
MSRFVFVILILIIASCKEKRVASVAAMKDSSVSCSNNLPERFAGNKDTGAITASIASTKGMIWIEGGEFMMGAAGNEHGPGPHKVKLKGYWIDAAEVTNAQFAQFVQATGYVTTAEKDPDWEEIKKQVPEG